MTQLFAHLMASCPVIPSKSAAAPSEQPIQQPCNTRHPKRLISLPRASRTRRTGVPALRIVLSIARCALRPSEDLRTRRTRRINQVLPVNILNEWCPKTAGGYSVLVGKTLPKTSTRFLSQGVPIATLVPPALRKTKYPTKPRQRIER